MASSSFYKVNCFVEDVGKEEHQLATDTLMVLLTNTLPVATDTDIDTTTTPCQMKPSTSAEIAAGGGYTKGGNEITGKTFAQTSGVAKLYGTKVTFTATGAVATFRYAVIYNNSGGTTSTRPMIGWYDYGTGITLGTGETFVVGNSNDGTDWTSTYPILTIT